MRLILVPAIAALAISCAQAAPQFDNSKSWGWGSIDFSIQSQRPTGHRNPNLYGAQQPVYPQFQGQNDHDRQGSSNQCWDPVSQAYRDWPNRLNPAPQFPSQFYNNEFLGGDNRNPQFANQFPGSWDQSQTNSYLPPSRNDWNTQRGPSPPPPPPHHEHDHGHRRGHGPPPPHHGHGGPPPPHHGHGGPPPPHHGHGRPPPPHHGHGHGPPPPPPGYGYGHGPPPPPHRPPYNQQNVGDNGLGICKETPEESTSPNPVEPVVTSTQGEPGPSSIPTSYPEVQIPDTTAKEEGTETSTIPSVKVTTEFDWNNFFLEASPDNPGGAGVIDVRLGENSPDPTTS